MTQETMTYAEMFQLTVARLFVACNFEPNEWLEQFIEVMCCLAGDTESGLDAIARMIGDEDGDGLETLHGILRRAHEAHVVGDDITVARLICEWQPNIQ